MNKKYKLIEKTTVECGIDCYEVKVRATSNNLKELFHELQKDLNQYAIWDTIWHRPEDKNSSEIIRLQYIIIERFWQRVITEKELTIIRNRFA